MPTVKVTSPVSVIVDGVPYGAPVDCIANNRSLAPHVQNALVAYVDELTAQHAQAINSADARFDSVSTEKTEALARLASMITDRDQHRDRANNAEVSLAELTVAKDQAATEHSKALSELSAALSNATAERDTAQARVAELEATYLPLYDANGVPKQVSNYQLRSALIRNGIMPSTILEQLRGMADDVARETALAAWEYANNFERGHPLVAALSLQFGLTPAQVDDIYRYAATVA